MAIQTKEDNESEPLYWEGKLISGMGIEELKCALMSANIIILTQRDKLYRYEQEEYS